MHDFYTRLAQSNLGRSVFDSAGLPTPPKLRRSPEVSLELPRGRILIAGATRARALKQLYTKLSPTKASLATPLWDLTNEAAMFSKTGASSVTKLDHVRLNRPTNSKFKALIFDATGINAVCELSALYVFFHNAIKNLRESGRVIVISNSANSCDSPEQKACAAACRSFIQSIAKEIGAKGSSANLIELDSGAEKNILPAIAFFLSRKSSYVTGQSIRVRASRSVPENWHKPLAGKTALVTGAAFGIGAETAKVLARDGAVVVCLDIPANQATLNQFASNIGGHALTLDLLSQDATTELVDALTSQLGIIDIVVHNAGITRDKTLRNMSPEQWNQVLDLNLEKITAINQALLEKKALSKNARIIGVSSISGIAGNFGQTNYACSKGGLAGYVEALAEELEQGITINAVAPGFIETRMTGKIPFIPREMGRRSNAFSQGGLPLDVAEVISFFCQPASQSLNGNVLRVCGQSLLGR